MERVCSHQGCSEIDSAEKALKDIKDMKAENERIREKVFFVNAVGQDGGWASLGKGDIIVDSAADESCWPIGQGDAFPTKAASRKMILRTANGGDMDHYGEKEVIFK